MALIELPQIEHVWVCLCRAETVCRPEDFYPGAVYQCPGCERVWACVSPRRGGKAWVRVTDQDAEFHRLMDEDD
jgi:hypothetical protein